MPKATPFDAHYHCQHAYEAFLTQYNIERFSERRTDTFYRFGLEHLAKAAAAVGYKLVPVEADAPTAHETRIRQMLHIVPPVTEADGFDGRDTTATPADVIEDFDWSR